MSRPKNETPCTKVTVQMRNSHLAILDRAAVDARAKTGVAVDRSAIIAAVIESADVPQIALEIAKGRAS